VEVTMTDGTQLTGRVGEVRDGALSLVVRDDRARDWTVQPVSLDKIVNAVVQVEFSNPPQPELELATGDRNAGAEGRT
jgi:ribosome maturation factor RimP